MATKHRLLKLEASERAALIAQIRALETRLSERMSDDQRFAVATCLSVSDARRDKWSEMTDEEINQELAQQRQAKSLADLRGDVSGLQWAHRQWDEYERNHQNSD